MKSRTLLLTFCLLVSGTGPAAIQSGVGQTPSAAQRREEAGRALVQGRQLFEQLEYGRAVLQLERVIALLSVDQPVQAPEPLIQAYELQGQARFALGDPSRARQEFEALLALDPYYRLGPRVSPRVVALFDELKRARGTWASLAVITFPDGVDVAIDGVVRGRTTPHVSGTSAPFLWDLLPGVHQLKLSRDCYATIEQTITQPEGADDRQIRQLVTRSLGERSPGIAATILRGVAIDQGYRVPVVLSRAEGTLQIPATPPGAVLFVDGASRGPVPPAVKICAGPRRVEVKAPSGWMVSRRTWNAGDTETLSGGFRPAFPVVKSTTAMGPRDAAAQTDRLMSFGKPAGALVFVPSDAETVAATAGLAVPPDWLMSSSKVSRADTKSLGLAIADKFESQGVAAILPGDERNRSMALLAILAAGSSEPDIVAVDFSNPASFQRAVAMLNDPLPPVLRPTIDVSVADVAGVEGAVVLRVEGSGPSRGGPAAAAPRRPDPNGLVAGDVIVGAAGKPVKTAAGLRAALAALNPEDTSVGLDVKRRGAVLKRTRKVTMAVDTIPLRDPSLLYNRAVAKFQLDSQAATDPLARSAARLNLAVAHIRLGDWSEALIQLLGVSLPHGPGVAAGTVAYLTGLCFEALGQTPQARKAFTDASRAPTARLSIGGPLVATLAAQKLRAER